MYIPVTDTKGRLIQTLYTTSSIKETMNGSFSDDFRQYAGKIEIKEGKSFDSGNPVGTIEFSAIQVNNLSNDETILRLDDVPPVSAITFFCLASHLTEAIFELSDFQIAFAVTHFELEPAYDTDSIKTAIAKYLMAMLHTASPLATRYAAALFTTKDKVFQKTGWNVPTGSFCTGYVYDDETSFDPADPDSIERTDTVLAWIKKHDDFCQQMSDIASSGAFSDKNSGEAIHMLTALKDTNDELPSLIDVNWQRIARILRKENT